MSIVQVLPHLRASGGAQMAFDVGLLETADEVIARRYTWAPPTLSLGRFQRVDLVPGLPFDVVRRPSGGRAVLHGEDFEWSFAVAFPAGVFGTGARGAADVRAPYELVSGAFAAALAELGVQLDDERTVPYQHSALCFAGALRHDVMARGEKVVAVAQVRRGGRVLVHGSLLEQSPPEGLIAAVEQFLGEPWEGEGLAGAGATIARDTIWKSVLVRLEIGLRRLAASSSRPSGE